MEIMDRIGVIMSQVDDLMRDVYVGALGTGVNGSVEHETYIRAIVAVRSAIDVMYDAHRVRAARLDAAGKVVASNE